MLRVRVLVPQDCREANARDRKSQPWVTGCWSAYRSSGGLCRHLPHLWSRWPSLGVPGTLEDPGKARKQEGRLAFRHPPWAPSPSVARPVDTGQVSQERLSGWSAPGGQRTAPQTASQATATPATLCLFRGWMSSQARAGLAPRPAASSRGPQMHLPPCLPLSLHLSPHLSGVSSCKDTSQLGLACPKNLILT